MSIHHKHLACAGEPRGRAAHPAFWQRQPHRTGSVTLPWLLGVLGALLPSATLARVDLVVSLGKAAIPGTDVELSRPDATRVTYHEMSFRDESFRQPFYWSVRANWWRSPDRGWGWGFDFTHAKAVGEVDRVVPISGHRAGVQVDGAERVGDTLEHVQLSHGLNLLTVNLLHRWSGDVLRPYAGVGIGVAVPHVEVVSAGDRTDEYQLTGPAGEGRLGLETRLGRHVFVLGEYKLSYVRVLADLQGGGTLTAKPLLHQLVVGVGFHR